MVRFHFFPMLQIGRIYCRIIGWVELEANLSGPLNFEFFNKGLSFELGLSFPGHTFILLELHIYWFMWEVNYRCGNLCHHNSFAVAWSHNFSGQFHSRLLCFCDFDKKDHSSLSWKISITTCKGSLSKEDNITPRQLGPILSFVCGCLGLKEIQRKTWYLSD